MEDLTLLSRTDGSTPLMCIHTITITYFPRIWKILQSNLGQNLARFRFLRILETFRFDRLETGGIKENLREVGG